MAKTPVDETPAGPEMDAMIADTLGLTIRRQQWPDGLSRFEYFAGTYANEYDGWAEHEDWRHVLPYSTDIAAAWELLGHFDDYIRVCRTSNDIFYFDIPNLSIEIQATSAPLAICRAFLKVNGVEYVKVPE
jgi:hypothetical protein